MSHKVHKGNKGKRKTHAETRRCGEGEKAQKGKKCRKEETERSNGETVKRTTRKTTKLPNYQTTKLPNWEKAHAEARRRGEKRENGITQRHRETESRRGSGSTKGQKERKSGNETLKRTTRKDHRTTKPPNCQTPQREAGWKAGGKGMGFWRAGGFALDGREGSGHNEGGARENMRQK